MIKFSDFTCIHLQQSGIKRVCNGDRILFKSLDEDRIFEYLLIIRIIRIGSFYRFFKAGLAVNDLSGIRFSVEVDRVGMPLFIPSGLITYLQPVLVGFRRQTDVDVASAGERLKAFLIMSFVLVKRYFDHARAVFDYVTFAGQKSRYLKGAFFK